MALSASCTAICTIVKTRVCCPAEPTTALALAFQSMTGSAMAAPGKAKATAAASSQRRGIGKLEARARTDESFIRDSFGRYSGADQRERACGPADAIAVLGEKRGWLRKAAGEITGPLGPSAWRGAVQRWPERYLAALFLKPGACWAHARDGQHHPSGSGMEDACGLSDQPARRRGRRCARR